MNQKWMKLPDNTRVQLKHITWKKILENKKKAENWHLFSRRIGIPECTLKGYVNNHQSPLASLAIDWWHSLSSPQRTFPISFGHLVVFLDFLHNCTLFQGPFL